MKEVGRIEDSDGSGVFHRVVGMVPKIGPAGEFMAILSSLTEKSSSPKEVLKTKDGYFVVKLSALEPADQAKFPAARKDLEKRLLYQKQEESVQNWLKQLRAKAKIEISKDLL
jgi:peptidyl-prolyl cis-trans isomerase D